MKHAEPIHLIWWLVSRASGIVALVLISLSVLMGLAMAARVLRRPAIKRAVARLHEHVALVALVAIVVHGLALLGDQWLKPGWRGIAVPFAISYRPSFTGLGIIAGYLAALLGPSFYVRKRIGARRWRKLHRFTVAVWVLSAIHALGAGSDGSKLWLQFIVLVPVVPIVYLLVLRLLPAEARGAGRGARAESARLRNRVPDVLGDIDNRLPDPRAAPVGLAAGDHLAQVPELEQRGHRTAVDLLDVALRLDRSLGGLDGIARRGV